MTTTDTCIACGSRDLRRDEEADDAWMCNACEYEGDRWRQLRARRWVARTVLKADFDPHTRTLVLPFGGKTPERWETVTFAQGVLEGGFAAGNLVALRLTLATPGFESLFEQGYRPNYDQWAGGFSFSTIVPVADTDSHVVAMNAYGEEHLEVGLDPGGRLVWIAVSDPWVESIPSSVIALGGRLFEADTGE